MYLVTELCWYIVAKIWMLSITNITNEMVNSLQLNKKRDLADNSSEDIKSDKRFKINKLNVLNVDYKNVTKSHQSLYNVPKQVNFPMPQVVDSYSSVN